MSDRRSQNGAIQDLQLQFRTQPLEINCIEELLLRVESLSLASETCPRAIAASRLLQITLSLSHATYSESVVRGRSVAAMRQYPPTPAPAFALSIGTPQTRLNDLTVGLLALVVICHVAHISRASSRVEAGFCTVACLVARKDVLLHLIR